VVAEPVATTFAGLLRRLRIGAGLTQEELAEVATLSVRSISDLERGINLTARKETARLLGNALQLTGPARAAFEAAARGRPQPAGFQVTTGAAAATRTLPRDISSFAGRKRELGMLTQTIEDSANSSDVVGIHAIGGMAGVGKTAFAVHAAHRLAPRFPDGQIFLSLHGHTPGRRPVAPAQALVSLLLTVGMGPSQIPGGLDELTALWRDRLVGKHFLLLLDDAVSSEQIQPLIPGTAGNLVLITSRRHLTALEDAHAISLDPLSLEDASALLVKLAGRPGLDRGDQAVAEIIGLSGCLPLSVAILARQLHHHPAWSAVDLAADLAEARDRLELMQAENLSVAAAFGLSYKDLTVDQQRLFRRLGIYPGTDIDVYAAAALDEADLTTIRSRLSALYDHYLVTEPAHGRYRMHDLIREHARVLAAEDDTADTEAAVQRLLDYYLFTARAAGRPLARRTQPALLEQIGAPPLHTPDMRTREDAIAWMEAERLNMDAAIAFAAAHDQPGHATAIPAAMHDFLRNQGYWEHALMLQRIALDAARSMSDERAEANALTNLGNMQSQTRDISAAIMSLSEALRLSRGLGDRLGEAHALRELGMARYNISEYAAASVSLGQALELYRALNDRLGQANCLIELGAVQTMTSDYPTATANLIEALRLCRGIGDRLGESAALNRLGGVQHATADYLGAIASLTEALRLCRALGNQLGVAGALIYLGDTQCATGEYSSAIPSFEQALKLYRDLGNRLGEGGALTGLGAVQYAVGDYSAATASQEQALAIFDGIGNQHGMVNALIRLGRIQQASENYPVAAISLGRALEICRDLGDRLAEAEVINTMGELSMATARPAGARIHHEQALAIAISIAAPMEEARALEGIGQSYLADGPPEQAAEPLRQALRIYKRIASPYAQRIEKILYDHDI
jgi:tetratricopeptide (TPR) repeat protein/transcriptional regulator with XRE-family HTH domain